MKWLSTILVTLAMGTAGILPNAVCATPSVGKPGITKSCCCCECGGGGVCCMKSSNEDQPASFPIASLPVNSLQGLLSAFFLCVGDIVSWAPEPVWAFAQGQVLPDSRRMYQRIQVFLI